MDDIEINQSSQAKSNPIELHYTAPLHYALEQCKTMRLNTTVVATLNGKESGVSITRKIGRLSCGAIKLNDNKSTNARLVHVRTD